MAAPRIIYGGDEAAAHLHLPVAQNLLHKARTMASAYGSGITGLSFAPTSDSYIYVLKVGNTEVINIFSAPGPGSTPTFEDFVVPPDFLSGVTRDPRYISRTIEGPNRKPVIVNELTGFKPTGETAVIHKFNPKDWSASSRLAVKPWPAFNVDDSYGWLSQYNIVAPSMYSGRMRKLVQVVLGYGRLKPSQISTTGSDKAVQVSEGIQVRYDFRWHRTHVISVANDGKLWLVEISIGNGVIAMQLPLIPDTAKLKSSDRESIAAAAAEFGGLPNGLDFPTGGKLDAAIKAGTILRLAKAEDLAPFYAMTPFSSAMGWTVNDHGTEAHNTGTYWGEDAIRRSAHFGLRIRIGGLKKKPEPKEPIADASASLYLLGEGKMYHPSLKFPPPIKFYEPLLGYLLSVEMLAGLTYGGSNPNTSVAAVPLCMCPMHVCFTGDQLKVVWYFWDRVANDATTTVTTSDFEECMLIGSWRSETAFTSRACQPTFMSMDFDMRTIPDPVVSTTDVSSVDIGWSYHSLDDVGRPQILQWAFTQRLKQFASTSVTTTGVFTFNQAAIVIPGGMRDGYVYADLSFTSGSSWSTSYGFKEVLDIYSYSGFRTFYYPPPAGNGCITQYDYKILEEHINFGDSSCSDQITKGSWSGPCVPFNMLNGPGLREGNVKVGSTLPSSKIRAWMVTNTDRGTLLLKSGHTTDNWRARSPDEYGDGQTMNAYHSCFGEEHIAYDQAPSGGMSQIRLGSLIAGGVDGIYNFLGVL